MIDGSTAAALVAAPVNGNVFSLYYLADAGGTDTMSGPFNVLLPFSYVKPPPARQPGTLYRINTGQSQFVNAGTQNGSVLWQVHTIDPNNSGFPIPVFYAIDLGQATLAQYGFFRRSNFSFDFNASIAANASNSVFVTWTDTDLGAPGIAPTYPEVRCSGKLVSDSFIPSGSVAFTGSNFYVEDPAIGVQRWGDYSAVMVDPNNSNNAFAVNQKINPAGTRWGTRIFKFGF